MTFENLINLGGRTVVGVESMRSSGTKGSCVDGFVSGGLGGGGFGDGGFGGGFG